MLLWEAVFGRWGCRKALAERGRVADGSTGCRSIVSSSHHQAISDPRDVPIVVLRSEDLLKAGDAALFASLAGAAMVATEGRAFSSPGENGRVCGSVLISCDGCEGFRATLVDPRGRRAISDEDTTSIPGCVIQFEAGEACTDCESQDPVVIFHLRDAAQGRFGLFVRAEGAGDVVVSAQGVVNTKACAADGGGPIGARQTRQWSLRWSGSGDSCLVSLARVAKAPAKR